MSIDDEATQDLALDDGQAEAVTGGAVELGAGDEALLHGSKETRMRRSASDDDPAPNQFQVKRNDKF